VGKNDTGIEVDFTSTPRVIKIVDIEKCITIQDLYNAIVATEYDVQNMNYNPLIRKAFIRPDGDIICFTLKNAVLVGGNHLPHAVTSEWLFAVDDKGNQIEPWVNQAKHWARPKKIER